MSRIRTVKPSFWRSQTLSRVSRDARLVFVGLWNEADDEGRLVDAPKLLAGALFPFDEDFGGPEIEACLRELAGIGAIERYAVEGSRFITIPRFRDHQVISKPRPSALPGHSRNVPGGLPEASRNTPGTLPERSGRTPGSLPVGMEWNGMEEEEEVEVEVERAAASGAAAPPEPPPTPAVAVAPPPATRAQRPRLGPGVIGLEMRTKWPQSAEAIAAWTIPTEALAKLVGGGARVGDTLLQAWGRRFPCFDGGGDRPTLDAALRAPARHWLEVQEVQGKIRWSWPEQAIDEMARWLTKDHETAKRSKAMDERASAQGVHLDGSGGMSPERRSLHDRWKRERERGADLPPFAEWVRKVEEVDASARSRVSGTRKIIEDMKSLDLSGGEEGLQMLKQRKPMNKPSGGEHEASR